MSQDNVELVYRAHEAFNQRNFDAFVALTDPEAELIPLYMELPGVTFYVGHDGVRSWRARPVRGDGDDNLFRNTGDDRLFGELGNDDLDGGDGTDSCDQGSGTGLVVNCEL
jgi:Ca2+-binding RTX toxin-like protein